MSADCADASAIARSARVTDSSGVVGNGMLARATRTVPMAYSGRSGQTARFQVPSVNSNSQLPTCRAIVQPRRLECEKFGSWKVWELEGLGVGRFGSWKVWELEVGGWELTSLMATSNSYDGSPGDEV